MLDAYVIEEIKRRDRQRERDDRPVAELPVPPPPERKPGDEKDDGPDDRGVVIIDYSSRCKTR
jgi:hypothetical protein